MRFVWFPGQEQFISQNNISRENSLYNGDRLFSVRYELNFCTYFRWISSFAGRATVSTRPLTEGFNPRSFDVRFLVDKVAQRLFRFPLSVSLLHCSTLIFIHTVCYSHHKYKQGKPGNLPPKKKSMLFWKMDANRIEKYFHFTLSSRKPRSAFCSNVYTSYGTFSIFSWLFICFLRPSYNRHQVTNRP